MQPLLLLCLLLLSPQAASLRHRHHSREVKKKVKEPPTEATVAPSSKDLAFDLYRALASAAPTENIFFSPLSISTSLAMLSLGARSDTKTQILEGLGLSLPEEELHRHFQHLLQELSQPHGGFQLSLGNALFTDPVLDVQPAFLSALKTLYLADIFPTNFGDPAEAKKQINDYVAKQTQGKIGSLIENLDSTQIMVMVNYIFFKAEWETGFSPKSTRERDFHVTAETAVQVPMMHGEGQYYYVLDDNLSCSVVGLPYHGNATAVFVLPDEDRMAQVEKELTGKTLRKWLRTFRKRKLELFLPKFSIEGSYQLERVLPRLGISDAFTSHADLSGINNHSNIQVSEMVHKAMVEVNESGTKATAATGSVFTFRSAQLSSLRVVFNRPFLMSILDSNLNILFLGKVTKP
ncbi:plasma serine protease inhibitor [Tupaia chinensis]|nr:plasma serine protease inhibitor [Tupaia chinensis]XP_006165435.1 plasma serine protease inhibitor [Tupaia chinensis]